jgi:hypothetical protein
MTKAIKQECKTDCCAAVAAMLTKSSIKEFKKDFGPAPEEGYWNCNVFDYAEKHNIFLSDWVEKKYYRGRLRKDQIAMVTVVSERMPDKVHAIFWDGKQIYDPHPEAKNGRDIKTYDVVRVVYFTEEGRPRKEKWKKK